MVTTSDPTTHPHHNLPTPDPRSPHARGRRRTRRPGPRTPLTRRPARSTGSWRPRRLAEWIADTLVDAEPPPAPRTPARRRRPRRPAVRGPLPPPRPPTTAARRAARAPAVRTAYQQALDEHDTLALPVATFNGPAVIAAMPQIRDARRHRSRPPLLAGRARSDRPMGRRRRR